MLRPYAYRAVLSGPSFRMGSSQSIRAACPVGCGFERTHEITDIEVDRPCVFFSVDERVGKYHREGRGEKEILAILDLEV